MKLKAIAILLITLAFYSAGANNFYPEKQALKLAKSALKDKNIQLVESIEISNKLGREEPFVLYRFAKENGEPVYVAYTQSKGRYDYFDYLVSMNKNFEVEKVRILKYRSEHGGEIAAKKWLGQFEGYTQGELRYKKDISAISGATISASSITRDVPKVVEIVRVNVTTH